uniref:Uncharacterized protein n=1 Tax=Romanomermis culicivorax TaxID=13658 RepID=A0A915IEB9_ROMCU
MILFKQQDDHQSLADFKQVVHSLQDHKNAINFLYADGVKFAHPLHHLGKTTSDLPIIAIDSFRHMYLFTDFNDLKTPGKLRQFIDDMHSGKLHREFHHGPDPTDAPSTDATPPPIDGNYLPTDATPDGQPHDHKAGQEVFGVTNKPQTSPPLSVFQKLKPSKARYTLKEEL